MPPMPNLQISASILSCDFAHMDEEIKSVSTADWIHVDVMDGHFVPNITIGPVILSHIHSKLPKEVHLMIEHPLHYVKQFVDAGSDRIIFHHPSKDNTMKVIEEIRKYGKKVGIAINPDVSVKKILPFIPHVDMVLCMTVFPGFSGQAFIPSVLPKVEKLRKEHPSLDIEVDGGVTDRTGALSWKAGANVLVAATFIFGNDSPKKAISLLRKTCG